MGNEASAAPTATTTGFLGRAARLAPGLGLVAAGVAVAVALHWAVPAAGTLVWSVLLGVLVNNVGLGLDWARAGLRFATRRLLRLGVVLLGFQLAASDVLGLGFGVLALVVATVVLTFVGTYWLGRRLGVRPGTSLLTATGFSICGASAIAAMDAVSDSDEEDVATGIALITVCGSLAILAMPGLGALLGLSATEYGIWVGASVQEVAQVVAAASAVGGALAIAIVVKLTRVVLLAPMIALAGVLRRRRGGESGHTSRPPLVPLFVAGFIGTCALRSSGVAPDQVLEVATGLGTGLLAAAMFGLGAGVRFAALRATGLRPLALGLGSWVIALGVPYLGLQLG